MMIKTCKLTTDINVSSLKDLVKLRPLMENDEIRINKSQIARELGVDRRTVGKYIEGFQKSKTRQSSNCLTGYHELISELLSDNNPQIFYYRRVLWQYLVDNHGYEGSYSNFCHYLNKDAGFAGYFRDRQRHNNKGASIRYETTAGKQAQLDWKESVSLVMSDGEILEVNIFVLLLSYSRFRVYRLSLARTQDILLSFLDDAFEQIGGVPDEILTDNMTTVMTDARTPGNSGTVNQRFEQFAKDYGFKVRPCLAGTPKTKGKVEAPMKILDELRAYNGKLDYVGFQELLARINDRENSKVNRGSGRIPVMYLPKEKDSMDPLPPDSVRSPYQMPSHKVKVNSTSMVSYRGSQYSVPPEYISESVMIQAYDGNIYVYHNTTLIAMHRESKRRLNYAPEHYMEIARRSHAFSDEDIEARAKENLRILGGLYDSDK